MNRVFCTILTVALALPFILTGPTSADCQNINGVWKFAMGPVKGQVEYKADGSIAQDIGGVNLSGTYTLKGTTLTTIVNGKQTVFTIVSCDPAKMTQKRNSDGKMMNYTK